MAFPTTFVSLQNRVIQKSKANATDDLTLVKDMINVSYAELVLETEWSAGSATQALTAGTDSYALSSISSAIGRIKAIQITASGETGDPLEYISLNQLIERRRGANTRGTPYYFTLLGYNTLELFPNPDAAATSMKIYYVGLPTALSADADVPILGEPYGSSAIEYGALYRVAEAKWDPSAMSWLEQAELWRGKLLQHLDRRRGAQPREMEFFPAMQRPPHDPATIPSWYG